MMYFPLSAGTSPLEIYEELKRGFSHVLTIHPQVAGEICRHPDRPLYAAIRTSEESSIKFTFKDHTTSTDEFRLPSYERLKELNFPAQGMVGIACPPVVQYDISEGSPIFACQANFVEGGLILTTAFNHVCIDGGSWTELFRLWALYTNPATRPETSEEIAHSMDIVDQLSAPLTSSTGPDPRTWTPGPIEMSTFRFAPPNTPSSGIVHPKKQSANNMPNPIAESTGSQIRFWSITSESQALLKATAQSYSTILSIFALFWSRNATHSRLSTRHPVAYARIPIDMRARITPPVATNYIGNTVQMITTSLSADVLAGSSADQHPLSSSPSTSLAPAADALRTAIQAYKPAEFYSFIGTANSLPETQALVHPFTSVMEPCVLLNDHSKMPLMGLDFGGKLGKTESLRDAIDDFALRRLNIVLILPRLENGTLEVVTLCDHEVNAALEKDEEILKYFNSTGNGKLWS